MRIYTLFDSTRKILGWISGIGGAVGLIVADYTFTTSEADVVLAIGLPLEDPGKSDGIDALIVAETSPEFLEKCRNTGCNHSDVVRRAVKNHPDVLEQHSVLNIAVFNSSSEKQLKNLHLTYKMYDKNEEFIEMDRLSSGQTIEPSERIIGTKPFSPTWRNAAYFDVCISYRGRYHLDTIRKEMRIWKSKGDLKAFEIPFIGFDGIGDVNITDNFSSRHCVLE